MRRKRATKRPLNADPMFGDFMVERLINNVMLSGKKSVARSVVYDAIEFIKTTHKVAEPVKLLNEAIINIGPLVEVKSRRVGGANYQVPREVSGNRRVALAMRWLLDAARSKKGKPMAQKLAEELMLASKNEGSAIKKKEDTHKMAEANKAFAHFAW